MFRHATEILSLLSATEEAKLWESAVPIIGAQRVFQPLRLHKQTRSVYEMEEREATPVH